MLRVVMKFTTRGLVVGWSHTGTPVCCSHLPRTFKAVGTAAHASSSQRQLAVFFQRACSTAYGSAAGGRPAAGVIASASAAAAAATTTAGAAPRAGTPKLLVIDGHNMAFKAYWGLMNRPGAAFCTADGIPTTVTFGFLRSLIALLEQEQPDALVVAFDAPAKSFRHDILSEYKAQRAKAPPEFSPDLKNLQRLLRFLRIQTVSAPGYEADDVMAGIAQQGSRAGYTVRIYTSDQDLWQVVDDAGCVGVLVPAGVPKGVRKGKGQPVATLIDEAAVKDKLAITPAQVPDYKALVGDSSDNLPGIQGIGPKTAAQLLHAHHTLEGVFQAIAALKPAVRSKLEGQQEVAATYKNLARIRPEAASILDISACHLQGFNADEVKPLLERLEMMSLVKALPQLQLLLGGAAPASSELAAALPDTLAVFSSAAPAAAGAAALQDTAVKSFDGLATELPLVQRAMCEAGPVSVLPDSLQARLPVVNVVASSEQLQQLLDQLQHHQGPVTWSWPQNDLYRPGSPPALPSFFCCAWQQVVQVQQPSAAAAAAAAAPAAAAVQAANTSAAVSVASSFCNVQGAPDPSSLGEDTATHRHTTAGVAPQQRELASSSGRAAAAAPSSAPAHQQPPPPMQAVLPRLAVIQLNEQLPGVQVLAGLQPLLQDAAQPKVLFESKRCYTEMHHWGTHLAGIYVDVLVAGYLTDPERWTEVGGKAKVKALDPERQQYQALPCMVRDVLNTTLPDMQAALAAEHRKQSQQQIAEQHGSRTAAGAGVSAAPLVGTTRDPGSSRSSTGRSRRRLSRRRMSIQTEAATEKPSPQPAEAGKAGAQAPPQQLQQPLPVQPSTQQLPSQQQQQQQLELPTAAWHAAAEAWASQTLCGAFLQQLQQLDDGGKLLRLLQDVEVPLQRVLSHMELTGIGLDTQALQQNREALQADMAKLEDKLFDIAGKRFNLSSRQTLSRVIYEELQLKPKDPKCTIPTTATGTKSTREDDIRKLEDHPFVTAYLEWIGLNTLLTKYYSDTYMNAVNPHTGRVHTTLAQVGAATGRIYSVNPNMQNIPAHMHATPYAAAFRQAFNSPEDGYVLVSADYSQVELRVLAALAQESALLRAFTAGIDVHEATARVLLDKGPQEPVTSAERQMGKRVNFSIVYGAGKDKIAKDAGVAPQDAKVFLDKFYAAYPGLHSFLNHCHQSAVAKGYTQSILGRRRLFSFQGERLRELLGTQDLAKLPEVRKLMYMGSREDAQVLRQAGNAPIQGTSADVLKVALCKLHSLLAVPPWNCRLLLTVHDSVVLEIPKAQWPYAKDVIASLMQNVLPEYDLQLKVDIKDGW